MVLNELGQSIGSALARIGAGDGAADNEAVDACLKEICTALLRADVNVRLVSQLRTNVKATASAASKEAGLSRRRVVEKAVVDELTAMLDSSAYGGSGRPLPDPKKGKTHVVMFVGLQGAGKTTTCSKYAAFYKRKGLKPALVCADTFRAGAFDQLKQNASKTGIPFYGSYSETDPARIAEAGVAKFKEEGRDLIIVDTSGRHRQEEALFEEMRQVAAAAGPDSTIFVMDGSIGQAAQEQAQAFRDAVNVGAVILTKMDGGARGGGALSAVAATAAPIAFLGTGEHMDEIERFDPATFVGRLLGRGDWKGFVDRMAEVAPEGKDQEAMMEAISKGHFTLRTMYDQLSNLQKLGPMTQLLGMLPGMAQSGMLDQGQDKVTQLRMRAFMTMMDSMTDKELDSTNPKLLHEPSRIWRVARGSGCHPNDVAELVAEYNRMRATIVGNKGQGGLMKAMGKTMGSRGGPNPQQMAQMQQHLGKMLPPQALQQMGGAGALHGLLKAFEGATGAGGKGLFG